MPDTPAPPTSEEVQPPEDRSDLAAMGHWVADCLDERDMLVYRTVVRHLADAYMVVVGQRDEAVRALEAFVFHSKEDGSIDYVASDYAIERLRSIQEKGAEGG